MELNKALLDCMQALRRRLRDELAVDIRLSQHDAINTMLSACLTSSDEETRQLGQRLAQLSDNPFNRAAGAPTPAERPVTPLADPTKLTPTSGSVRIYRGQRVYP
jgi:chemotaxis protein histidine kinase CheA